MRSKYAPSTMLGFGCRVLKVVKITLPTEQHNTSSANRARPMNRKFPERTTVDGKQFYQACPYSPRFRDGGVTTLPGVGGFFSQ